MLYIVTRKACIGLLDNDLFINVSSVDDLTVLDTCIVYIVPCSLRPYIHS